MEPIKGKDFDFKLVLSGNTVLLCHARDFTMTVTTEEIEVTGPGDGRWRKYIPGMNSYVLTVPGVITWTDPLNIVQLQEIQYGGQTVEWVAEGLVGGLQYHGFMFITSSEISSQMRDVMLFTVNARGTGPQDINKNPIIKPVYLSNTNNVRLAGCPNPYPIGILWYDGTLIGPANNADEVIAVFNAYALTQGGFLQLLSYASGCDFTMSVAWNSPLNPDVVYAVEAPGFAIRGTAPDEAIGGTFNTNEVISA